MSRNYWQKLQDIIRKYAHSHAMYHHLLELGKELGSQNQTIPQEKIKELLIRCDINQVDYALTGLFRGHNEGLKQWRTVVLQDQLQERARQKRQIAR